MARFCVIHCQYSFNFAASAVFWLILQNSPICISATGDISLTAALMAYSLPRLYNSLASVF
ncbi:MAG: hypothetical protein IK086_06800 [Clostridia bacterium]|nr:hypothetical protein [Clostridia bacterium]